MIAFTVTGDPQTKGSAKAFRHNGTGRIIVSNDNPRCKAWQTNVAWQAKGAMAGRRPEPGPVRVEVMFTVARPPTSRLLVPRLDVDKLLRALLDGMTGVVYVDDSQVVEATARKAWGVAGASVTVQPIEVAPPPKPVRKRKEPRKDVAGVTVRKSTNNAAVRGGAVL